MSDLQPSAEVVRPESGRAPGRRPKNPFSGSLQTRLLLLLLVFSILPAILLGGSIAFISAQNTRQQVENSLNAVVTLKEAQVEEWLNQIISSMQAEIDRDQESRRFPSLLRLEPGSAMFTSIYSEQLRIFNSAITSRQLFEEIFMLNPEGIVVVSTRPVQVGRNYAARDFFRDGRLQATIQSPSYDVTLGQDTIIVSMPIFDTNGQVIGVMAGRAGIQTLNRLMLERTGIGLTGETYLVARNFTLLTQARQPGFPVGEAYARTVGATAALQEEVAGSGLYTNYAGEAVIGAFRYIPYLDIALLAEQGQAEAFQAANLATNITIAAIILAVVVAIFAAFLAASSVTQPLSQLTAAAQTIASGNIGSEAEAPLQIYSQRSDEIGFLAASFQTMTIQLRQLIQSLESRIEERTQALEKRGDQLMAAAEVARSVTTILDTRQLLQQVVDLIQQRFELYYVGLFLNDEADEWAVLTAGTGQAGQAMLARQHRLRIARAGDESATSMIGWAIANAQPRIALEAGQDAVRLASAELPNTRSEAAIPLRSRGQVLGAISIQSRQSGAFDNPSLAVFQTMADQVGAAIDNARLFDESQRALEALQQAYGQLNRQAWLERLSGQPLRIRKDQRRSSLSRIQQQLPTSAASPESSQPERDEENIVQIPIQARGQVIGHLDVKKHAAPLNPGQVTLLKNIVEQLGLSLDSARLFEETQMQAERQRLVGEIAAQMRSTLDIDHVLQTAARQIQNALNLAEVEVRLVDPSQHDGGDGFERTPSNGDATSENLPPAKSNEQTTSQTPIQETSK